ncbi:MAG: D-alanine--D-alanine ligase family protein [Aggregatilineales bacterium]
MMATTRKTTVGVVFGGRSVEHDVSIITANQIMRAFDPALYDVVPVYVSRDGRWYTGAPLLDIKNYESEIVSHRGIAPVVLSPAVQHHGLIVNPVSGRFSRSQVLRLDVVFPAIHGTHGEDGTLQGLLELADIPYVGCGVLASAIANDKITAKALLSQHSIPVVEGISFSRADWLNDPDAIIARIERTLAFPVFVKPATTGSSIGIGRAGDVELLRAAVDTAAHFDRRVLVEKAVVGGVEINCAVLGNCAVSGSGNNLRASVLEQSVSWEEFLTYDEKYRRGSEGMKSAERIIPAPIGQALTAKIQEYALRAFHAIDGRGTARIDFLVKPEKGEIWLNEINTMPGSLAFYLWQESGMSAAELVHQLVVLAREAHAEKRRTSFDYQKDLIALAAQRGLKGVKGAEGDVEKARA